MAERGDLADIPDQGPWEDEDEEGAPDEDAAEEAPEH
jgi:hypothetical protein